MDKIQKLKDRLVELHNSSAGIQAKADAETRELTVDERTELDTLHNEFEDTSADLERLVRIEAQATAIAKPGKRQTDPDPLLQNRVDPQQRQRDGLQNTRLSTQEERQRWGFNHAGDFYKAVKNMALNPGNPDPRLIDRKSVV